MEPDSIGTLPSLRCRGIRQFLLAYSPDFFEIMDREDGLEEDAVVLHFPKKR
jgi:hypothetical protein